MAKKRKSNLERLKAYKLTTQLLITILLFVIALVALSLYLIPAIRNNVIAEKLLLALFTSLLVSVITMLVNITIEFNKHKSEEYLENLREFGIGNLYPNKENTLKELLVDCDRTIWVSGYRLIMTNRLKQDFAEAVKRGADYIAVITPPWSEAYKLVYGDDESVINNYINVFEVVNIARKSRKDNFTCEVYFVNKPLFSDTYRVDQKILTGPYMHNKDKEFNRLMARDFFSYDIVRQSNLAKLVNDEYRTLCDEAEKRLDWDKFESLIKTMRECETDKDRIEIFKQSLIDK